MKIFVFLLFLLHFTNPRPIVKIDKPQTKQQITAYTNQAKSIPLPFHKCFKAQSQIQRNAQYIQFKPTRLALDNVKSYSLKGQASNIDILEQLRSPISYKHRHIILFQDYLMVFAAPNVMLIVEQNQNGFRVKNKYLIQDLKQYDQFKMYKLGTKALMVIYNQKKVLVLNKVDYRDYNLPYSSAIIHLQQVPQKQNQFFAAQFRRGLTHYRLDQVTKTISIVKSYNTKQLGFDDDKFTYVVDVNLQQYNKGTILALDAQLGIVQIDLNSGKGTVIVSQRMCQSFDSNQRDHIVLLCQNQGHSTILQVFRYLDPHTNTYKYHKIEPKFHANYLNDLHLAEEFYLVYSYSNIHVFWNIVKTKLPQSIETESQISLPGLQTFLLKNQNQKTYMYTIQDGQLKKYEIREQKASLKVVSSLPIEKQFKLYLYGSCNDLQNIQLQDNQIQACQMVKYIGFKVIQQDYPRDGDVGVSAIIIIILILVFLIVIWICLSKYKGLEREARKVLESYQKRKSNQRRPI